MKKNDQFNLPRRQSKWAIIFIVLKFIRRLFGQLWPILIAFFIGRGNQSFDRFEMALAALGVFGMVTSIISYFKYYYYISENELVIEKGVLKKIRLNVPFERVQSINFKQNFIHQLLRVTEVEIETAGSDQSELQIDALDLDTADQLRSILLNKRNSSLSLPENERLAEPEVSEEILSLSVSDLLTVGLVQNHFKPIGLLIGLIGSAFAYSYTFDYNPVDLFNQVRELADSWSSRDYWIIAVLLLLISVLYSVISTYLLHYDLQFSRVKNKFQVTQGLFTKKQFAALDNKIQILSWGQNPLERLTGLFNIFFRQAQTTDQKSAKMQFKIPGCKVEKVTFVKDTWLGKDSGAFDSYERVSRHFYYRPVIYMSVFFAFLFALLFYLGHYVELIFLSALWSYLIYLSRLEWSKKRFSYNGKEVYVGGGILGYKHSLLPVYKIQNMSIHQNPYQWRRGLATLRIHTAAGQLVIPYVAEKRANEILDQFIYGVEVSNKPWM